MSTQNTFKILPYHYIHVLDKNSNITRIITGPKTFVKQDHEDLTTGGKPLKMIIIPPQHFCMIENPVKREATQNLIYDKFGQIEVKYGEKEYRFNNDYKDPFPLYPKEVLVTPPSKLQIIKELTALKLQALRSFTGKDGKKRQAGEIWQVVGPAIYYPRVEEKILEVVNAKLIGEQQALRLKAINNTVSADGNKRITGEEWLIKRVGEYLPNENEQVVALETAKILTKTKAIQLRAIMNYKDAYGVDRKAGEEWLVTYQQASYHLVDIYEIFINEVELTILGQQEYCVILNPFDPQTGKNKLGGKELRVGDCSFFLQPGEEILDEKINDVYLLQNDEALLLKAKEQVKIKIRSYNEKTQKIDEIEKKVFPGEKWLEYGPGVYIPPISVDVVEVRKKMILDKNEGIYIRDTKTGKVRLLMGECYMLKAHEVLWDMELSPLVEQQLSKFLSYDQDGKRLKYKVVTYQCPFNSAVQVYNYFKQTTRIEIGPSLVVLQPDEQFVVKALSGQTPKKPGVIQTIFLRLGPDFSTDIITVETSDHAALKLKLSYNWKFKVDEKSNQEEKQKIFQVADFVGDLCNVLASKIRASVAQSKFDEFHQTSAKLIRKAIFGVNEQGKINSEFFLEKNNLAITNVDIQSVEPIDSVKKQIYNFILQRTRQSLEKIVMLAIEITTNKQEAIAKQQADKEEEKAKGKLGKQIIEDKCKAEEAKKKLFELEGLSKVVQSKGLAVAQAEANIQKQVILAESELKTAELKAEAKKIQENSGMNRDKNEKTTNLEYEKNLTDLELAKAKSLAQVESKKFKSMIESIGKETIVSMAQAGPELQAQLLQGLGLQGFIMTDGNNPINLFNTAQGLIGQKQLEQQ